MPETPPTQVVELGYGGNELPTLCSAPIGQPLGRVADHRVRGDDWSPLNVRMLRPIDPDPSEGQALPAQGQARGYAQQYARDYPQGQSRDPSFPLWILSGISHGSPEGSPLPGQIVRTHPENDYFRQCSHCGLYTWDEEASQLSRLRWWRPLCSGTRALRLEHAGRAPRAHARPGCRPRPHRDEPGHGMVDDRRGGDADPRPEELAVRADSHQYHSAPQTRQVPPVRSERAASLDSAVPSRWPWPRSAIIRPP